MDREIIIRELHRKWKKNVLWKILCPYLVNIRKLDYEQSFEILKTWLEKRNNLRKLDFNPNTELKTKLRYVKQYNPISFKTLEIDNEDLYLLLKKKVIILNNV